MNKAVVSRQLGALQRRVNELQERATDGAAQLDGVLPEAFQELQTAVEELQVAEEELRRQNDQLLAANDAITAAQQRYQDLFDFAPDGYLVTDPNGVIQAANQAAARLLRTEARFLAGKPLVLFIARADRPAFDALLARLHQGEELPGRAIILQPRVGPEFPAVVYAAPLRATAAGPAGFRWLMHDTTAVKEAQERALQAERLAAIGQMVAGLTHESRNVLQRTQACLEMLALDLRDRPESLDLIRRIQSAQDSLHHLLDDVRNYAAPIRLICRARSLANAWRDAWAHLEPTRRGRAASLRDEIPDPASLVTVADGARLEQVFRNILENSLAACPDPVEITVTTSPAELAGQPAVRIAVRDNGPGLSAEQRTRIFEPFYTTKTHGTGLGMAIATRIVQAHGGQIAVGDGTGRGAEIVLLLPKGKP